ncbi:MAG: hypothetical protein JSV88_19510 [Candidatus Aminicenantes bacterium]|nr:MAG: hypothetical protein JSV88_19510 [Candidatus Aminicenantes bacterium]
MRGFILRLMIGCLVLSLGTLGLFSQVIPAPAPEVSLDDYPAWANNGPVVPPYGSAENEWGQVNAAFLAGFIGPSPTLGPVTGFFDSDILIPGPAPLISFPPPPFYVDAISCDHSQMPPCPGGLFVRFSVDRPTGGVSTADASYRQAMRNEQPADIYRTDRPYTHVGNFVPLAPPAGPPWYYGGFLPTAGSGAGAGAFNQLMFDHFGTFGFFPPPPCPAIGAGTHDNVDAFNEWPVSILDPTNLNNFFALHPASAFLLGFSAADIFICANPPGLYWPTPPPGPSVPFVPALQMGLDTFGINTDSIDGLAFWDMGIPGLLEPGIDFAAFSLAPGSATLATLAAMGLPVTAADVFLTDFQINPATGFGYFYTWLIAGDLGVGNNPNVLTPPGPLPVIPNVDINVDALDLTIDPEPVPYINPITKPITDPGTKK